MGCSPVSESIKTFWIRFSDRHWNRFVIGVSNAGNQLGYALVGAVGRDCLGESIGDRQTKGKIFGSVNTIQLAESLKSEGFEIDRKYITIKEDLIKEVGSYTATVKLHKQVSVEISFEIVAE